MALAALYGVRRGDNPDKIKRAEFNTALGSALSNWQNVEWGLALIFEAAAESRYALFIFEAITSTREKLFVLNALLQIDFATMNCWAIGLLSVNKSAGKRAW
jgi:hypothetical protein